MRPSIHVVLVAALAATGGFFIARPALAGTGVIKLTTAPEGASVMVGGKSYGKTPVLLELPAGTVSVTLAKDGFRRVNEKITVIADQVVKAHFGLEPLGPQASGIRIRENAPRTSADEPGTVTVITSPSGLSVFMNGEPVPAQTPVTFDIDAGAYEMTLEREGEVVYRRNVVVRPGGAVEIEIRVSRRRTIDDTDPWSSEPVPATR